MTISCKHAWDPVIHAKHLGGGERHNMAESYPLWKENKKCTQQMEPTTFSCHKPLTNPDTRGNRGVCFLGDSGMGLVTNTRCQMAMSLSGIQYTEVDRACWWQAVTQLSLVALCLLWLSQPVQGVGEKKYHNPHPFHCGLALITTSLGWCWRKH